MAMANIDALASPSGASGGGDGQIFQVFLSKEEFKFNASHFIAFDGFRERLHGHNYRVAVKLTGRRKGGDGYLIDFGDVKKVVRKICKELNEYFLCPMNSDVLQITKDEEAKELSIICQDGSRFLLPLGDCKQLPLVHSSAEELAVMIYGKILDNFTVEALLKRSIFHMEVSVAEAPGQEANFSKSITDAGAGAVDSRSPLPPKPCKCNVHSTS